MSSVVILGGGISGLMAAYALRRHKPVLLEASPSLGGSYMGGGLKYIRDTPRMRSLLARLNADHGHAIEVQPYKPRGGIFIDGEVRPHPEWMMSLAPVARAEVQLRHWEKTRGTRVGFTPTCMNDPSGEAQDHALKLDHGDLLMRLTAAAEDGGATFLTSAPALDITSDCVSVRGHGSIPYKRLITTLPMPLMRKLAPWANLPEAASTTLTVAMLRDLPAVLKGAEAFDYVYTPDLPLVHRVSPRGDGSWQAEAQGRLMPDDFQRGLGWGTLGALTNIPGHLLPLPAAPKWPDAIYPLGRYAMWDSRMTAEKSWAVAHEWEQTWPA